MSRTPRALRLLLLLAAVALLLAACGDDSDDAAGDDAGDDVGDDAGDDVERGSLTIGSVDFDENVIVASMYAEVLEAAGYDVERRFQLGTREVVLPSLSNGELDIIPDYIGSSAEFLEVGTATTDTEETAEALRELLADDGIVVLEPAPAQNTNALVVTRETAEEFDLETTSDLAAVGDQLVLGGPPECPERPLCLIGFEETYGIEFADFQPTDAGGSVTVEALEDGDIDVALLFSTDESIRANDWVVLEDDQNLQPVENIAPLVREDSLNDEIRDLLNDLSAALTTSEITELNRQVRLDGEDPEDVAATWVDEQGLLP